MSNDQSIIARADNRLQCSRCDDELFDDGYLEYQHILDQAYDDKKDNRLGDACARLERAIGDRKSLYQSVRTEYLFAEYYEDLEGHGETADRHGQHDPIGAAVEHYARAAEIAREIPDLALVARIKSFEGRSCFFSNPHYKRLHRSFLAARDALDAWQQLPDRTHTGDLQFEFELADAVGVRALAVAEDYDAVEGLERAATLLAQVSRREDRDVARHLNDEFFLEWNWAALDHSRGELSLALNRAFNAREMAQNASEIINYGRVNALIAEIALDCVDNGVTWGGYSEDRLLNVAERAKNDALKAAETCDDKSGYVLALLVQARWLRRTAWKEERHEVLKDAEKRASALLDADPFLFGRVEIAWGDEFAFLYAKRKSRKSLENARRYYLSAEKRLADMEVRGLARIAHKRLLRLHQQAISPPVKSPPRKPNEPRPDADLSLN
ncbi:MAG TPA: hypothetical protein VFU63_14595 [Ktedonobacterales bacterium]|nr:hypothetical protein [Ktedonobacterales bacterium]